LQPLLGESLAGDPWLMPLQDFQEIQVLPVAAEEVEELVMEA
jgi:hypothetical protein